MSSEMQFKKYQPKFQLEAWIRSLLCGLCVGFGAAFVAALSIWFLTNPPLVVILIAFVAGIAVATPIFYLKKFKPTIMTYARRLDRIGLEERMITMVELQDDASCMAQRQRQDAQQAMETVGKDQIKLTISRGITTAAIICGVLCIAMSTVCILSAMGLLIRGDQLMEQILPDEPEVYLTVTYIVEDGGYIEGEADQMVLYGENASPVLAVADEGFAFVGWDDGSLMPAREEWEVTTELTFTAMFAPLDEEGVPKDGDSGDQGEPSSSEPGDKGDQKGENEGEPNEDGDPGDQAGGKYDEWNHIIDGEIYYREFLESYKERLLKQLEEEADELTEEEKAIIEAYINLV